jgi:hypothetical protein
MADRHLLSSKCLLWNFFSRSAFWCCSAGETMILEAVMALDVAELEREARQARELAAQLTDDLSVADLVAYACSLEAAIPRHLQRLC